MRSSAEAFKNGQRSYPEIDRLLEKLLSYREYDYHAPGAVRPRMEPMTHWVKSRGEVPIFPGGCGVYGTELVRCGVMLIFQDYDVQSKYRVAIESGYLKSQLSTGRLACAILEEGGVNLASCYFTNRFVGVRDAESQYGANPAWRSPKSRSQYRPYMKMCDEMLRAQLDELQPRLVLTFGAHEPRSLGLADLWHRKIIERAQLMGHSVTIASLVHTSFRNSNIGKARYDGLIGHKAEIRLLRVALGVAGLDALPSRLP